MNVPENKKYIYYLIIILIFAVILDIIILIIWLSYNSVNLKLNTLIKVHGKLSDDSYKLINYYQLMIFYNYTIEDINRFERYNQTAGQDIFSNIYSDIEGLYNSKKLINKLKKYNLGNIESYYNFTCLTYYNYLFQTNEYLMKTDIKYKDFLMFVCEQSKIFKSTNYKQIFAILLEYIQIGINEINDRSYEGLIKTIQGINFAKTIIYFLFDRL